MHENIPTNKNGKYQKSSDLSLSLKLLNISCPYINRQNTPVIREITKTHPKNIFLIIHNLKLAESI